ncbi:MAG TPA: hypothetical protein VN764_03150 [Polyangiaceae bacterium]|nr:hypothetical protein [Polyangiaceae bacterium]
MAFSFMLATAGVQACQRGCTDIGCSDQVYGTIRTVNGALEAGHYVITLTTQRSSHTCTMDWPDAFPGDGIANIPCNPELGAVGMSLRQDTHCTEEVGDDASSNSCSPIPDQYTLTFIINDTPDVLTVQVERDGDVLGAQDFTPDYDETQPNGKGCPPVCEQAEIEMILP